MQVDEEINMKKYEFCEKFVKKVFKKVEGIIFLDNNFSKNSMKYIPDFMFELDGKKYCVEVKLKFSPSFFGKSIEKFNNFLNEEKISGIIVVLDKISGQYKDLVKKNYNIEIYDISNILYLMYDDEVLLKELKGIINFSLDNIIPQKSNIEMNLKKSIASKKDKNFDYIKLLAEIKDGTEDAKNYEKLLEKIIKDIFSNELTLFQPQSRTEDGINIFDMICKIKNDLNDDFFSTIEKFYKTKYILFEFKNYKDVIKQGQICTTEKYLYETALRKVAIVITRHGIDKNGMKLAKGILRESGKLIIVLDDNDLKEMIRLNEIGEKATIVLSKKLDELLTKLEK